MKRLPGGIKKENRLAALLMALFVCAWLFLFLWDGAGETVETVENILTGGLETEEGAENSAQAEGQTGDGEAESSAVSDTPDGEPEGAESDLEDAGEVRTIAEAALQDSEMLSAELQAAREQLLLAQLPENFQIPMRLPEDFGALPAWRSVSDCSWLVLRRKEKASSAPEEEQTPSELGSLVSEALSGYDGDWSVYFKNLRTGESFVLNDQPMDSASVMKLFIMGTVYTAIENGELERTDETMSLVKKMISNSDNTASNRLLYLLGNSDYTEGIARVNAFIAEYGFSEGTVEYNGFNDDATVTDSDSFNQVTAKDCGKLLEDIYRRAWVSRDVSNEIEAMLLAQATRYKIPAGLPDGVACGNKSGEMDATENDAAIIYSDSCDYILVVLSGGWSSKNTAISRIAELSSMVYEYLNPQESTN